MQSAFVLFKTSPTHERDVYLALSEMDAVQETHALYGEYDLIARIHAKDSNSLTKLLLSDLRSIAGVTETQTLVAVDY